MAESQEDLEEHTHQSVIRVLARLVKILAILTIPLYDTQLLLSGIAIPPSRSTLLLHHPMSVVPAAPPSSQLIHTSRLVYIYNIYTVQFVIYNYINYTL